MTVSVSGDPNKERNCNFSTRNVLMLVFSVQVFLILLYFNFTKLSTNIPLWSTSSHNLASGRPFVYRESDHHYQQLIKNLSNHTDIIIRFSINKTQDVIQLTSVAIGMGITARGWIRGKGVTTDIRSRFVFFSALMPSFCETASKGYSYTFYLGFDENDAYFSTPSNLEQFRDIFVQICQSKCSHLSAIGLVFVKCSHHGKPAWAQNDAMMAAYMDDVEYFYRINDDTKMTSKGWTETFINQLLQYHPPNVGVVGPNHKGGNVGILTYDFVHRMHVDLLGFYYPREFTDWHADRWITDVYNPGRITKIKSVHLLHTMSKGTRYKVHKVPNPIVLGIIQREKERVLSGMKTLLANVTADPRKVISMGLTGMSNADVFGAVRNAVLRQMYFPEWTMHIFVEKVDEEYGTKYPPVAENVLKKLDSLQVKILLVNTSECDLPPALWPLLVAENTEVDYFILRHPTHRLNARDASVVTEWISSGKSLHCIRDHLEQKDMAIVPHLWGVKATTLRNFFSSSPGSMNICSYLKNNQTFSLDRLWSAMKNDSIVHDSVSCDKWNNTVPFPMGRDKGEYLGQVFGACGEHETKDAFSNRGCIN